MNKLSRFLSIILIIAATLNMGFAIVQHNLSATIGWLVVVTQAIIQVLKPDDDAS
jgi:hypothetical protein